MQKFITKFPGVFILPYFTFFLVNFSNGQSALDRFENVSLDELENPPEEDWLMWRRTSNPVSYTHLTLPTKA